MLCQKGMHLRGLGDAIPKRQKISWTIAIKRHTPQGAFNIGQLFQSGAHRAAQTALATEKLYHRCALIDRCQALRGCRDAARQKPRSGSGHRAIYNRQQRDRSFPCQRLGQFKVFSGCGINCNKIIPRFTNWSAQKWELAFLGGGEIFNKPRNGGDIGTAELSKTAQVSNTIGFANFLHAGGAVKNLLWQFGHGRAGLPYDFQSFIQRPLSQKYLSRGKPGQLWPQSHGWAGTIAHISGRNIHPSKTALVAHLNKRGQKITLSRLQ